MPPPTSTGPRPPPAQTCPPPTRCWRSTCSVPGGSPTPCCRCCDEADHPRIVNVSSGAGSHRDDQFGLVKRGGTAASYGISKAALNALTSTLAAELADTPILAFVCPGLTATWPGAEAMGARPVAEAPRSCGPPPCPTTAPPANSAATDDPCPGKDIGPAREAHIGLEGQPRRWVWRHRR